MSLTHHEFTGSQLHVPGYIQSGDPGAVGTGKLWFNTSTGILKIRNAADDGWDNIKIDAGDVSSGTLSASRLPSTADMNARVAVRKNSTGSVSTRRRINFIEGTNVTVTVADDSTDEEVDVTITASGGGGSGTETLITETVVGVGGQTDVDFTSISSSYRHLRVIAVGRLTTATGLANFAMRFNNDSAGNYDRDYAFHDDTEYNGDTEANQTSASAGYMVGTSAPSGAVGGMDCTIYDYRGTTFHKSWRSFGWARVGTGTGTGNHYGLSTAGQWKSTSAINRVTVLGAFAEGTVVSLYGRM